MWAGLKEFGSHPVVSRIISLLVSSLLLGSGLAGDGGFWLRWLLCVCRFQYLSLYLHLLTYCYLSFGVFVAHDNNVPCLHISVWVLVAGVI